MGIFSGSDPEVGTIDTRTGEQMWVSQLLANYFSGVGTGLEGYRGQLTAGMSGLERGGLASMASLLGSGMPDIYNRGVSALTDPLSGDPTTEISPELTEQYFTEGIYNPMFRSMQEDIIPEIEGAYAGNYWGTPRASATSDAWVGFEEDMTSVLSELIYADEQTRIGLEESAADRQLSAAGVAGSMAELEENIKTGRIEGAMTYGSLPRLLMQAELDARYNEWLRTRPEYNPIIEQALAFMGIESLEAYVIEGQDSAWGSILGSALGIGAVVATGGLLAGGAGVGIPAPLIA